MHDNKSLDYFEETVGRNRDMKGVSRQSSEGCEEDDVTHRSNLPSQQKAGMEIVIQEGLVRYPLISLWGPHDRHKINGYRDRIKEMSAVIGGYYSTYYTASFPFSVYLFLYPLLNGYFIFWIYLPYLITYSYFSLFYSLSLGWWLIL